MNTLEAIEKRRSVRSYLPTPVEKEKLEKILYAALQAPTGKNRQPLFFVIRSDEKKKEELLKRCGVEANYYSCPAILFILKREEDHLAELDCGAAVQNALLEATELGVSSCWIHSARASFNTEEGRAAVKEILELSKEYEMMETVALGYLKGEEPIKKERRIDGCKIL